MITILAYLLMTYLLMSFIFFGIDYFLLRASGDADRNRGTLWFTAFWPLHAVRFIASKIKHRL